MTWTDRQGDVWTRGTDGLLHTPETAPFPREHVEKKWGPLVLTRHLLPHAEFGDDPSGHCGCEGCDPRPEDCARCRRLPLHRTEAGWPHCSTCDGGGCPDCTDPA